MHSTSAAAGTTRTRVVRSALVLAALATFAVACGGSGDSGGGSGGGDSAGEATNLDVACRAGFDPEAAADADPVEPEYGGTLVYGVESETDGWNPVTNRWSLSGNLIAESFYDTLTKPALDGTFAPYLAESVTPNDDYTVWTITVRDGVTFHDGTPLTGEAVKMSLDAFRNSALTGTALSNIADVTVTDPLSVEVTMNDPWVPFPQYLASQVGVVMAPSMFDDPDANTNPVGTGPFRFESWTPDSKLVVVRNEDYWQTDAQGNQLPYLDGMEFVPLPDPTARKQALDAGNIQMLHTYTADQITDFRNRAEAGEVNAYESCAWGEDEEFLIMFNNGKPPFDEKLAREIVARAIDRQAVVDSLFGDVFQIADGPFAPGSPWYVEPDPEQKNLYDPELAAQLAAQYEEEHGEPLSFTLGAPASIQEALTSQQLVQGYLKEIGVDVTLANPEFATYVLDAVTGDYEANIWRQFGSPDPDGEYVWWHPDNVRPEGELSLNIARFSDEALGAALDRGRQSPDPEVRKEAYAEVQRIFRDQLYLGWSTHAFWSVATLPEVQDVVNWRTPDGDQGLPLSGGTHPLAQIWLKND